MRTALDKTLRGKLEKTVEKARDIVEVAVTEALTRLGIGEGSAPNYLSEAERKLRTRLRAHGRQLGDVLNRDSGKQETELLVNEMAYEHWHRMLFARFLEQSDLLMYDQNTHVTLDECFELAEESDPLGDGSEVKDGWDLAGRLAQKMLPQIFRADSPVFDVKLSLNHVHALEELIADIHLDTFQASDALGWCYQFWQNKKKKQVNESGVKIGAKELSPVTQLFTEPYMVSFLLDNALGAWWAKRRLTQDDLATANNEQELRDLASIPGVPLEYLRFVQDETTKTWSCASGDFDKWPDNLSEFKTLDPCCGSGHFLVAKFLMLVPIRMELEGLTAKESIDKVLAQNIHGLELDQRCVELAAFALALEAWRYPNSGGYRQLPELQLACSGISITEAQKEWKDLLKADNSQQSAVKWMHQTYINAPVLGSLIEPENRFDMPWNIINSTLIRKGNISEGYETISSGLVMCSSILTNRYHFIATNPPYLTKNKFTESLNDFVEKHYPLSKLDLATVFIERIRKLLTPYGVYALVTPQHWFYLSGYKRLRQKILENDTIKLATGLGGGADSFSIGPGNITTISMFIISVNEKHPTYKTLDLSLIKPISNKIKALASVNFNIIKVAQVEKTKGVEIVTSQSETLETLNDYVSSYAGLQSGDFPRFGRKFFELSKITSAWSFQQSTVSKSSNFGGLENLFYWQNGQGEYLKYLTERLGAGKEKAWLRGENAWGKKGVSVRTMGELPSSMYLGTKFDNNVAVIIPDDPKDLPGLWMYCSSPSFNKNIRSINQKLNVDNGYLLKANYVKAEWDEIAIKQFPYGLPLPYCDHPTQWVFHGHPSASVTWNDETKTTFISELRQDDTVLQVAVARLLGYRWPAELDTDMELAPEMREIIAQNKVFDGLVDDDGIVCIPAIRGEKPAVDRLEAILHAAYGDKWSATVLNNLLKSVKSRDLNLWLRDKFFEQHSKLFQHRPFIWHIWDGLPDGFSALVNYHQLDYKGLERLIYTYLDDWISTQIQLEKDGDEGAEIRLAAARNLRKQLEDILVGEQGLDIFVRWKPLAEQPIGWNPDLNDGVRLNIRPFMKAKDVGKKDAGILRSKPNIHWKKDRGTDVESAPWYDLGLEYGGKQGDRINDHHLTLAEKSSER
jgi:hypothetical protein